MYTTRCSSVSTALSVLCAHPLAAVYVLHVTVLYIRLLVNVLSSLYCDCVLHGIVLHIRLLVNVLSSLYCDCVLHGTVLHIRLLVNVLSSLYCDCVLHGTVLHIRCGTRTILDPLVVVK